MSNLVKGIIVTSIAIPVSIIGMNVVGRVINKRSKKNAKKSQKNTKKGSKKTTKNSKKK